jgi:hypothetical protein
MRPPPYPKKIEIKENLFFYFKLDASTYSLFDSTMSTPIVYGSYNLVASTISKLSSDSTIFYFELDNFFGWKLKKSFKPDKKSVSSSEKRALIETKK